jgi:hypothetical protein
MICDAAIADCVRALTEASAEAWSWDRRDLAEALARAAWAAIPPGTNYIDPDEQP